MYEGTSKTPPTNLVWLFVMIAGALADLATTELGLASGKFVEGNPLGQHPIARWVLKGALVLACSRFAEWAEFSDYKVHANLVRWGHVACNFGPALWNAHMLMMVLSWN